MRFLLFLTGLLIVSVSCKHETFIDSAGLFEFGNVPGYVYTSDSIFLGSKPAVWTLLPGIGKVTAQNYYVAPSSVLADSQQVVITARTSAQTFSKTIFVVKSELYDTVISFSKSILPLMAANCNFRGCHGNGSKAGKVDLSSYEATMKNVVPYQPGQSLLYLSLVKPDPLRRMPPAGALHPYRIRYFNNWIEQGALNN